MAKAKTKYRYRAAPKKRAAPRRRKKESVGSMFLDGTLVSVASGLLPVLKNPMMKGLGGLAIKDKAGQFGRVGKAGVIIAGYELGGALASQVMGGGGLSGALGTIGIGGGGATGGNNLW